MLLAIYQGINSEQQIICKSIYEKTAHFVYNHRSNIKYSTEKIDFGAIATRYQSRNTADIK